MKVLKFGGTSMANSDHIQKVVSVLLNQSTSDRLLVVVSAMSGVTDHLLKMAVMAASADESYTKEAELLALQHLTVVRELLPLEQQSSVLSKVKQYCNELDELLDGVYRLKELSPRTQDKIVAFGEILSSVILSAKIQSLQMNQQWIDSRSLIITDTQHSNAAVDFSATNEKIQSYFKSHDYKYYIAPGFIASSLAGHTTTLGRGGSDYSAAIYAAALDAEVLEIWTDVSGMMTADPRLVINAKPIAQISYHEAMELSHFGAKIIYPPTIQPVMHKRIPVWLKNTFAPEEHGTLIENYSAPSEDFIRGISSINSISLLSLEGSGMVGIPGFSKRLFEALANERINVILITQSSSEHSICVAINESDTLKAKRAIDAAFHIEIITGKVEPLIVETNLSILALVGEQMKSHPGISGKMFGSLGRNGINVRAIAQGSSEKNISAVIASRDVKKAINVLHETFFETTYKQLNIFVAGAGNVGGKLLEQIRQQQTVLRDQLNLQIRVIGIANSKKALIDENGIDLDTWQLKLADAAFGSIENYVTAIKDKNLRNSVFVDVTASDLVAGVYESLLTKSISIVACNKIACSSSYSSYQRLKSLAKSYNALFLFETNVGAGLPVIGTLNDLLRSGDQIQKIQAVLSGTLNYVFNHYDTSIPFAEVVRKAQTEGYTEPDPRLDLGGTDVMRKIMILARETGQPLEMQDIINTSFLPSGCFDGTVDDFYEELAKQEAHFQQLYKEAATQNGKLKFIATYENGTAKVGLEVVAPESDFYHLYGKDNLVLFHTHRYHQQPLVIKGAGAGAEVTASGVFADIIRVARI
jgi:bifunctional aspartokinase / homoserine dehydrogenase 1